MYLEEILRDISTRQSQNFIPRKWILSASQAEVRSNNFYPRSNLTHDKPKLGTLSSSLKKAASQGHLVKAFKTFFLIQIFVASTSSHGFVKPSISSLLLSCANQTCYILWKAH